MEPIEDLNKEIGRKLKSLKAEEKAEKIEKAKEKKENKKSQSYEKKMHKKKLKLLKEIFAWRDRFIKTKTWKGIKRHIFSDVIIFESKWGHKKPDAWDDSEWSRIKLYKLSKSSHNIQLNEGEEYDDEPLYLEGELEYESGWKWMGSGPTISLDRDKPTRLRYAYLKKFHQEITTGKVYKNIKDAIKDD